MLRGESITKDFPDRGRVLHDIDVEVQQGRITAVIGPSGVGKTTLLRALALIDPPSSGRITLAIDGESSRVWDFPKRGRKTGRIDYPWPDVTVVFQQLFLWPHLTLRDNILLPLRQLRRERKSMAETEIYQWIAKLDLLGAIHRYPNETSLGQRQRAALVRAVALKPRYLLLDEVTSALDIQQVRNLSALLVELREQGTGILIVSHLIGFAASSDRVVFIDDGHIVEQGPASILMSPKEPRTREFLALTGSMRERTD